MRTKIDLYSQIKLTFYPCSVACVGTNLEAVMYQNVSLNQRPIKWRKYVAYNYTRLFLSTPANQIVLTKNRIGPCSRSSRSNDYKWPNIFLKNLFPDQCDQIGLILDGLGDDFSCSNGSNILKHFGPFERCLYWI